MDGLSNIVENETSSLKPDPKAKSGSPRSAEDLAAGRLAVAEIAHRVTESGYPRRVAPDVLKKSESAAIKRGDQSALDAHSLSRSAAALALGGSNTTNGATQYRTRVGTNIRTPVGKRKGYKGSKVTMSF